MRPFASCSAARTGSLGSSEGARKDARPAARNEPDGRVRADSVQDFVETAVPGEDVDGFGVRMLADDVGRVPAVLGATHLDVAERGRHVRDPLLGDPARVRIDDEQPHQRGVAYPANAVRARPVEGFGGTGVPQASEGCISPIKTVETVRELVRVATRLEPRVGPVRRREREQRGGRVVEIGAQLAALPALAEERPDPLLVASPLAEDLVPALADEVAPLAHEDRRDVELLGDDAQVTPEREPDLLRRRQLVGNDVERGVERGGALAHRLVEEVLLRRDVRVERALLNAHRLRQVADRGPVVALLGEEPGRLAG